MSRTITIKSRFSTVFLLVLLAVIVLGIFSIWRLANYYTYSAEIDERFFRSTQFIGDLNNFTSDFRAAEATDLLSGNSTEIATNAKDLEELDRRITIAQHNYEQVTHDKDEVSLYEDFLRKWTVYRNTANHVLALSSLGHKVEATDTYMTNSRTAYNAASDTLGQLTDLNVVKAHQATLRANLAYREARLLTIFAITFAGLLVIGGLLYMRRSIANPLLDLAQCMHALARNETDVNIPRLERGDEIGEMARAVMVFRDNIIELAIHQKAMANQASLLSEKLQAEQHLTQLQRNFVSMASHEFRTPLTNIDGHAQRLINAKDRFSPDDVAERARKIRNAVLLITSVIENLINSSRLLEGEAKLYFHPTKIDLSELLREVCRLHREVMPRAHILEGFGSLPLSMIGDQKLLFQAFSNLLSNAIKYSPDGKTITINARVESGRMAVMVEDHGVGISEQEINRVFDRYFRGSNVSGIVGTGIGLYLVKTVIDLHGGDIGVKSRAGKGSTFTVILPVNPQPQTEVVSSETAAA